MSAGTVLITGASGGIGAEIARSFARRGWDLLLSARSVPALEALAAELSTAHKIKTRVIPADLGRPGAAEALAESLKDDTVDILVNNAGFATFGVFAEGEEARMREELDLNVGSLTILTRRLLPGMLARKRGRILNVASTAAFLPGPFMAVYYATKAYVLSLSVALRDECRGTGVTVTCLCPGPTKTGFVAAAKLESSPLFKLSPLQTATVVAEAGVRGCLAGKAIVFTSFYNRAQAACTRLLPRTWLARIARRIQAPD
ncbi:MAG: SDR family oxidoreductase [Candidatus Peribacteraceae bacterium]|nr:SDR family oxidoreductase [Candidatus Peribacteraceae bacterium]